MPTELNINLAGLRLAGLKANTGDHHKVLCIHGWLDNANSFLPLLPLVKNAEIVAIDLPGHGLSDHQESIYSIATQSQLVIAAANALEWQNFTLVGHSLGGCIAPFCAIAAKERIDKLILIEAAGPVSEPADALPARLQKFNNDMENPTKYQSRLFDSIDQAIESRLRANQMSHESARIIVERQLQRVQEGTQTKWQWRFDSKLRITSPTYFTEDQVTAVLGDIACPTLCILADNGYLTKRTKTMERLKTIGNCKTVTLSGYHHLHLDTPQPVADEINRFLQLKTP